MFNNHFISLIQFLFSVFGVGLIITIHELGHFLFCKLFNINAPKFAIGIGPKIFQKKIGETDFSIGIIPIAGYVQIGEESQQQDVNVLNKAKYYKGFFVLMGGIIFNIVFAYLVIISNIVFSVKNGSILKPFLYNKTIKHSKDYNRFCNDNDEIVLCNNQKGNCPFDYYKIIKEHLAQKKIITFGINRDGKFKEITYHPDHTDTIGKEFLNYFEGIKEVSLLESIKIGIKTTNNIIKLTIDGILSLFKKRETKNISGILGIVQGITGALSNGFTEFTIILAMISISLAIMNLLPLPVLDGGQLVILTISKIKGKDLSEKTTIIITYFSFFILALLTILSTYNDILRLIISFK